MKEVRKVRQESVKAELGPAGQPGDQEENVDNRSKDRYPERIIGMLLGCIWSLECDLLYTYSAVMQWNRLTREAVSLPYLETFKVRLDLALINLIRNCRFPYSLQRSWTR